MGTKTLRSSHMVWILLPRGPQWEEQYLISSYHTQRSQSMGDTGKTKPGDQPPDARSPHTPYVRAHDRAVSSSTRQFSGCPTVILCGMCVFTSVPVCVCICIHLYIKTQESIRCLCWYPPYFVIPILSEPPSHQLHQIGWPVRPRDPPVSTSPPERLFVENVNVHRITQFYATGEVPNSVLSTLRTESFSQMPGYFRIPAKLCVQAYPFPIKFSRIRNTRGQTVLFRLVELKHAANSPFSQLPGHQQALGDLLCSSAPSQTCAGVSV